MNGVQLEFFQEKLMNLENPVEFPSTRFQGSKLKIEEWIWENIKDINFDTALDAFGGTGCIAHLLKRKGKTVTYNDKLKFNSMIGKALIENNEVRLTDDDLEFIMSKHQGVDYPRFIQDNFKDIFFLDEENAWLDFVLTNINLIENEYKQALAFFCLFQSCIIKRPYNLFHRANLYVRTSDVERSFGNKTTWDTPFKVHFLKFAQQANQAIFDNGKDCLSINYDVLDIPLELSEYDLVYIDTPYISNKGVGTDYLDYYHFLEGMMDYEGWGSKLLKQYKHKPIVGKGESDWIKRDKIYHSFDLLFSKFRKSVIVVSYRADGIPSPKELKTMLSKYKYDVEVRFSGEYKYALSHGKTQEVLLIGQ